MSVFKIQDWAGNILNYKGVFERPYHAVAKTFNSFDDATSWLYEQLGELSDEQLDEALGEYYVLEEEEGKLN